MKKFALTMAVLSAAALTACGGSQEPEEVIVEDTTPNLETLDSKISYLLGYSNVEQLKTQGVSIEIDSFSAGADAAANGEASLISDEDAQAAFTEYQAKLQGEQQAQFDEVASSNLVASQAFLAENATKEGVTTTASGLQYKVIEKSDGANPTVDSTVQVHYEGRLISGAVFDSSMARGTPVEFALTQVISGWTEGLQLMPEGSKYEFYIPSELAYGENGPASIGPNQALIFIVDLIQANYSAE